MLDDVNRIAVLIENKIGTGEHSDQLNRYQAELTRYYPGYQVVALYLTPDGEAPTSDDYQAVSYTLICKVIENIVQSWRATLDSEIVMVLEHYVQMLRRHIVSDSDVAVLCRSIYKQHRQALDLIFEHRPDQQAQIGEYVESLIQQEDKLMLGNTHKTWVIFNLREWEQSPRFGTDRFYIYFEFNNQSNQLQIFCTIWRGDQDECKRLLDMARHHCFTGCQSKLTKVCRLAIISVLRADDYERSQEDIEALISERWAAFLRDELPRMAQVIRDEKWLWELPT